MPKIELKIVCEACSGTGLYVGCAERDGAAIQCYECKGTGCYAYEFEYEPFSERKAPPADIRRVYEVNPGFSIATGRNGEFSLSDFGGVDVEAWLANGEFPPGSENRKCTCPAWWYQSANYERKPKWNECLSCGSFPSCKSFPTKEKCWERFDKEGR